MIIPDNSDFKTCKEELKEIMREGEQMIWQKYDLRPSFPPSSPIYYFNEEGREITILGNYGATQCLYLTKSF